MLQKHPDKLWIWNLISSHSHYIEDFLDKFPDIQWCWYSVSRSLVLLNKSLDKYIDKGYGLDWSFISNKSENISHYVEKYPDKPWDWDYISSNPGTNIGSLHSKLYKYGKCKYLCSNTFYKYRECLENIIKKINDLYGNSILEELVHRTQHPTVVLQHLNKFKYNVGINEY